MKTLFPLLFVVFATALSALPQSGRRVTTPASTPPASIQPSLNPEPEIKAPPPTKELMFLPESVWERQIKTLDNKTFRLSDFQGKVIVINLWASWCGPCRREVPEYEKVRKAYQDRDDVEFIGLTTEDPRVASDRVKTFLREVSFGFRLGWAERDLALTLMNGRNSIPQTLVLNAEGRIVRHWRGYMPGRSGDHLKQAIEQALSR